MGGWLRTTSTGGMSPRGDGSGSWSMKEGKRLQKGDVALLGHVEEYDSTSNMAVRQRKRRNGFVLEETCRKSDKGLGMDA